MKYITIEHLERLNEIKHNKFMQECVDKLESIDYEDAFEENKERYINFVKHVYRVAKEYEIENKKTIFALVLLWYVEGDSITKDEDFLDVLQNRELSSHEKTSYFSNRAYQKMEERE